jgi:general nucleoside transport system permease protein
MIRLEARGRPTALVSAAAPLGAVLAALALATLPLLAAGAPIGPAFALMAAGAAGSMFALTETLTRATPLILTGLAAAVAFRARLYNVGAEGQLYAGALAAVMIGSGAINAPPAVLVPLILLASALAGALLMLGPTLLKAKLGVDEVVTTLLLNFIVLLFVQMMLEGPLKDPMGGGWPQSEPILDAGILPPLVERMRLHTGLILGVGLCVVTHIVMARTVLGLKIRAVGDNASAAQYAGISVTGVIVMVGCLSGALAGLAGASEVSGLKGYLTADLSRGFGYAGIVVAMIAGLQPLLVLPAAIFIAGIFVGADTMSRTMSVSNYIADLIVAFALLSVLVSSLFVRFRLRWR